MNLKKLVERVISIACSVFLCMMVLTTFIQIVRRALFGSAFLWSEELAVWSMVWMTFLGAALCVINNRHARIEFLVNKLPANIRICISIIVDFICGIIMAIMCYNTIPVVKLNLKNYSVGLKIPFAIYYLAFPIGGLFIIYFLLVNIYEKIRQLIGKEQLISKGEIE